MEREDDFSKTFQTRRVACRAVIPTGTRPQRQDQPPGALDAGELRELLPAALILESLAVRLSPPFDRAAIERLHRASALLRRTAADPGVAAQAEDEFHGELVRYCGDARLRAMARSARRALLPYRRAAPVGAVHHDGIVDALERGDNDGAADRIRRTFAVTLAQLLAGIERTTVP
jgi:DNA-binding GntR family transcriptional regulator